MMLLLLCLCACDLTCKFLYYYFIVNFNVVNSYQLALRLTFYDDDGDYTCLLY